MKKTRIAAHELRLHGTRHRGYTRSVLTFLLRRLSRHEATHRTELTSLRYDAIEPTANAKSSRRAGNDAATLELLRRYRRRPSDRVRNEIVELHRGAVAAIAGVLAARLPRNVDQQDLVHAGVWGLMQAIAAFDHRRGIDFGAFMRRRVRGAMLDELRNLDYLPRLYRQLRRERDSATSLLRARLLRDPSDAEIAAEIGVSETRLRRIATGFQRIETVGGAGGTERGAGFDNLVDDGLESPLEALDRQDQLAKIEASLQPIEWKVLRLHYLEGLPGKEIAKRLRLSASRICQIHGRVLSRLRNRLDSPE